MDAESGSALFAPFATPLLVWTFLPGGFGFDHASLRQWDTPYVGAGAIPRSPHPNPGPTAAVPTELVFKFTYLGSVEYSFSLNFSRPAAPVIAAYYNMIYLGFDGYHRISLHDAKNARLCAPGTQGPAVVV
ncbi:hypothetical protein JCM3770_007066 [Rhodotorula araucariae]